MSQAIDPRLVQQLGGMGNLMDMMKQMGELEKQEGGGGAPSGGKKALGGGGGGPPSRTTMSAGTQQTVRREKNYRLSVDSPAVLVEGVWHFVVAGPGQIACTIHGDVDVCLRLELACRTWACTRAP